ncbi:MAG: ATP-dependent DNA helicase RecG [Bdellovibrionota bacterium]
MKDPVLAIEGPLSSAAKDDFKNLSRFRGLGKSLLEISKRLRAGTDLVPPIAALLDSLDPIFTGLDDLPLPKRQERIQKALAILDEYRQKELPGTEVPKVPVAEEPSVSSAPSARERELAKALARNPSPDKVLEALGTEATYIKGVGPKMAEVLSRLGIETVGDLLWHLPVRYEDRRHLKKIRELTPGEFAVFRAKIGGAGRSGRRTFEALFEDETGRVRGKWFHFNERMLRDRFPLGEAVIVAGTIKDYRGILEIHHPEIELLGEDDDSGPREPIVPIYPLTEGLHPKRLRGIIGSALTKFGMVVEDGIPEIPGEPLPSFGNSLLELHRPDPGNDVTRLGAAKTLYHQRLRWHEAFFFQLALAQVRRRYASARAKAFPASPELLERYLKSLPFGLTSAQKRSLAEIAEDLSKPRPMHRLLQGDVGSGKTVVAGAACVVAIAAGAQAALMAPTEILAEQHFATLQKFLSPLGVEVALLTGSRKFSTKTVKAGRLLSDLASGKIQLAVGTHALIQEGVEFANLGLAIIDEQHRFGVEQRAELKGKGEEPHVLVMTATPIPRTLALTVYGELDVSVLDELPAGRKPISTQVFPAKLRRQAWDLVRRELEAGRQAYVVYPLVAESEKIDLQNAIAAAKDLEKVFEGFRIGLVHGRLKADEKDEVISRFRSGGIHLLVSTTVIEVGIDVPNATVMVVEHAERFGLSQLHQLRGRVGRGSERSFCLLISSPEAGSVAGERLKIMESTTDGFRIAEEDLRIRGPGEFIGTRQSGLPDFKVLNLVEDHAALQKARQMASKLLEDDPELALPRHRLLAAVLRGRWARKAGLLHSG